MRRLLVSILLALPALLPCAAQAEMEIVGGTTSKLSLIHCRDSSGAGVTGLGFGDFTATYMRSSAAADVDITEATMTAGTWASGGIIEIDATNSPGVYQVGIPDAAIADGDDQVKVLYRASGVIDVAITIRLLDIDLRPGGTNIHADILAISGDTTSADNLELMYDGTGYTDETGPSSRLQVSNIGAATGAALSYEASADNTSGAIIDAVTIVGSITANLFSDTAIENGTRHQLTHTGNAFDFVYRLPIGGGRTAATAEWRGYLTSNNDTCSMQAYDFGGDVWDTIATISGTNSTNNATHVPNLLSKHTGTGSEIGNVYIRFVTTGQSSPVLNTDLLLVQAVNIGQSIGYSIGSVWADSSAGNTNTEVFVDGVADNPVSSMAATNTLLSALGLHRVEYAPGSSFTLATDQTNETHKGRDWTLALGSQNITGSFFFGASVSGTGTATAEYEFEECDLGTVTLDNDGHFEQCALEGTFTIGQAGTFTFHNCYTESASAVTIDFAALGATAVHLFQFHGEITFKNMAVGDTVHITGAGTISTTTCTAGTIDHDGFFEYTDAGNNVTEQQSDIKIAVDATLVDTAQLGAAVGASLSADIAAVKAETVLIVADTGTTLPAEHAAFNDVSTADLDTAADTVTVTSIGSAVITAASIATDAIGAAEIAPDAIGASEIATGAIDADAIATDAIGASEIAASAMAKGVEITGFNDLSAAQVNTEVDNSMVTYNLDHLLTVAVLGADVIDDSVFAQLVADDATADWDTFDNTTDSLEALRIRGDAAWTTGGVSGAMASGTSDSGSTTTIVDTERTEADTDYWKGALVEFTSGNIDGQVRLVTGFTPGTDTITFAPAVTQSVTTQTYDIIQQGGTDIQLWIGTAPNSLVSGAVDADVSAIQSNAITAASIAADAIGASEIATDAIGSDEIASGAIVEGVEATGWNNLSTAQVNAEADTALSDIFLEQLFAADYDPATPPGVSTARLNEMVESNSGVARYTTAALVNAPSGTGGDASAANQTTILNRIGSFTGTGDNTALGFFQSLMRSDVAESSDIGGTFDSATDSLQAIRDRGDAAWIATGNGNTAVNHDTTGANEFTYEDEEGSGIGGASIRAYLKTEYDAGTFTLRGETSTLDSGKWFANLDLNSGVTYAIRFEKPGLFGPTVKDMLVP